MRRVVDELGGYNILINNGAQSWFAYVIVFGEIAIGLGLTLIHLAAIPVSNASVNPARSTATAVFAGGWALAQLWLFWVAPLLGGAVGGLLYRWLSSEPSADIVGDKSAALRP